MNNLHTISRETTKNNSNWEKNFEYAYENLTDVSTLSLPIDIPGYDHSKNKGNPKKKDIQKLYEELGCPFYHSKTKMQIKKLAKLQLDAWDLHIKYKLLMILKSQKIGISSLCILITIWHALTDCMGMEIIINAQSDDQAKTHAQDLRRIISGSPKYRDYLITSAFTGLGLLKDEVTKVHTIYLHNPKNPRMPTKIIVVGMSPGALLSHKRVGFIWSSDSTISQLTATKKEEVWGAMLSRRANTQGPVIVECPARAPEGPIYTSYERYEKQMENNEKINPAHDFHCFKFKYTLGLRDGFLTEEFIESEKRRLGPLFGTFYEADFFASGMTWYPKELLKHATDVATDMFLTFNEEDDMISDMTED
jgi:hypothetical protein